MTKTSDKFFCTIVCLVVASLAGFAAMGTLMVVGGWSVMQALFAAAVVWAVLSALLVTLICNGSRETPEEAKARVEAEMAEAKARATGAPIPSATKPAAASNAPAAVTPEPTAPAPTPKVAKAPAAVVASGQDDLKLLKGVGPKLEEKLHANGVSNFAQIAGWGPAEIADMDDKLSFKGRIDRDGWVEQAKILASGGETEFSMRGEGKNG